MGKNDEKLKIGVSILSGPEFELDAQKLTGILSSDSSASRMNKDGGKSLQAAFSTLKSELGFSVEQLAQMAARDDAARAMCDNLSFFQTQVNSLMSQFKFTLEQIVTMVSGNSFAVITFNEHKPSLIFDYITELNKFGFVKQSIITSLLAENSFSSRLKNDNFRNYVSYLSELFRPHAAEFKCLHTFLYTHLAPKFENEGFLELLDCIRRSCPEGPEANPIFYFSQFLKGRRNAFTPFKHPKLGFSMWKKIKEWYDNEQSYPSFPHFMSTVIQYVLPVSPTRWKRLLATILDTQENVLSLYQYFIKLQSKDFSSTQRSYFVFLTALGEAKNEGGFTLETFLKENVPPQS